MDEDRLVTLARRIDALERQNRRLRAVAMLKSAGRARVDEGVVIDE